MNDLKFAIPAAIFFATLAALLFIFGNEWVRVFIAWGLFVGSLGEFLAQDRNPVAQIVAILFIWAAILLTAGAILTFTLA